MKKKRRHLILIFCMVIGICTQGCRGEGESAQSGATPPANSNAAGGQTAAPNANSQPQARGNNPAASLGVPTASLQGTYTLSEVEHPGGNRVISEANATEIAFKADGTFARVSKKDGVVDHEDSGRYYVERFDRIVLKIMESKKRVQDPPVEKRHTFQLSPDGEELKMLGSDGKIGVFRRTRGA
jgi:hypothetical protein